MSSNTSKDFGSLRADYSFFEDHATEAVEDARCYAVHVRSLNTSGRPIQMLDFGCGEGRFTEYLLKTCEIPAERLCLTLVEPVDDYRRQAAERLTPVTARPINAGATLPDSPEARFDLVLANHVFYYVTNLDGVVAAIHQSLAPAGLLLAAMAGRNNLLIQFWNHCFGLIGEPVPFHTAEDFAAALRRQSIGYLKKPVHYDLAFPDSQENRLRILRFLLGSHFDKVPRQAMLDLFAPYAADGRIETRITHDQFLIRGELPRPSKPD
jgi:SAM-dependent methyltransferase